MVDQLGSSDSLNDESEEQISQTRVSDASLQSLGEDQADLGRGGIVTARGTGEGLIIRLDGRVGQTDLKNALRDFVSARESFLAGNDVALEWVGTEPDGGFVADISQLLLENFQICVKSSQLLEQRAAAIPLRGRPLFSDKTEIPSAERSAPRSRKASLFDGIEMIEMQDVRGVSGMSDSGSEGVVDPSLWDDPDARIIFSTLRSGQKVETEHSLVICGDVNSGAEVVAGGDIIVLGVLRGVAHAGAYDETGGGRFIFSLDLRPTQLRIGSVISRGGAEGGGSGDRLAEIARVDGNLILVEPYQSRTSIVRNVK